MREPDNNAGDESGWSNGVTLKKTRDGYTWSIAVAATDNTPAALREAANTARELDRLLHGLYPSKPGK